MPGGTYKSEDNLCVCVSADVGFGCVCRATVVHLKALQPELCLSLSLLFTCALTLPLSHTLTTDAPPQLPSWMSEQLLRSLTNVLLELPFSRRAETEADLIGKGGGGWGKVGGVWGGVRCGWSGQTDADLTGATDMGG